jgi:hypothetical protein
MKNQEPHCDKGSQALRYFVLAVVVAGVGALHLYRSEPNAVSPSASPAGGGLPAEARLKLTGPAPSRKSSSVAAGPGQVLDKAFDGSLRPESFWEAAKGFPVTVRLLFAEPIELARYAFVSDVSEPGRMPTAWVVRVSGEDGQWREVDRRSQEGPWGPLETRIFEPAQPAQVRGVEIEFQSGSPAGIVRMAEIVIAPGQGD